MKMISPPKKGSITARLKIVLRFYFIAQLRALYENILMLYI